MAQQPTIATAELIERLANVMHNISRCRHTAALAVFAKSAADMWDELKARGAEFSIEETGENGGQGV